MAILSELGQLLAAIGTLAVLPLVTWALGRWSMALLAQRLLLPLWRDRRRHATGLVITAGIAIGTTALLALAWRAAFDALAPEMLPGTAVLRDWLSVLVPGVATFTGFMGISGMLGRWRRLVPAGPFEAAPPALGTAPLRSATGRRIVILCDGTGNRPTRTEDGVLATTNVWKLYQLLCDDEAQITWYLPGIGTGASASVKTATQARALLTTFGAGTAAALVALWVKLVSITESALGGGLGEAATRAYTEIVRQYQPGDRIYLIGFSRGAYTVRAVAGILRRSGLLKPGNIALAPDLVGLHLSRRGQSTGVPIDPSLLWPSTAVEFLGVFDTVASLGAPLWGWWFTLRGVFSNLQFSTDPAPICRGVYHAMAMDERRAQFFPTPFDAFDPRRGWTERFEQTWFRGSHGDVGGGAASSSLSDVTLGWMMDRAEQHGLQFREGARATLAPEPFARMHDELARQPAWGLVGSWPRWHPVPDEPAVAAANPDAADALAPGSLDPVVLARADASFRELGRPDLLLLAPGEAIDLWTQAHRSWDRTGLVIERGASYRITWLGGLWRDSAHATSGPAGQVPTGLDFRRWPLRRRRVPWAPWMTLCATVAHRRPWPLRELGLGRLLHYLFVQDPIELRVQLAPIGTSLARQGDSLVLHSDAPAGGMLYLFANDWWQAATDNTGGLLLRVQRLAAPQAALPCWRLQADGTWVAPAG